MAVLLMDMSFYSKFLLVALIVTTITLGVVIFKRSSNQDIPQFQQQTKVIDYVQSYIPDKAVGGGWCWTESFMAAGNPKAWRCQSNTNNSIYDPCFETESSRIVCNVDLEKSESGFELQLVKPLEKHGLPKPTRFWKLRLVNSNICYPQTGTLNLSEEGRSLLYVCGENTGIFTDGIHKVGDSYEAEYVTIGHRTVPGGGDFIVSNVARVAIEEAWR